MFLIHVRWWFDILSVPKANGTVKRCPGRDLLRKIFPAMFRAAIQMKHRVNMKDMKGIGGDQDGQVDGADGTVGTVGIGIGIDLNGDGMVGVGVGTGIVGSHGATGVEVDMVVTVDMVDGEVDGEMVGEMDGLGNHQVGPTGPVGPIGPGLGILMPRMHSLNSMAPGGQVNRSNLKQVMKNDGNLKPRINWKMRRARRRIRPDDSVGVCTAWTSLTAAFLILKQRSRVAVAAFIFGRFGWDSFCSHHVLQFLPRYFLFAWLTGSFLPAIILRVDEESEDMSWPYHLISPSHPIQTITFSVVSDRIPLVWVNCLEMPPVLDFRVFRNNQPWRCDRTSGHTTS